jgi:hypothetical protein
MASPDSGSDGEEAAVAHDGHHARQAPHARFVDRHQLSAGRRRTHHTSEQHPGQPDVLNVRGAARELLRDVPTSHARADEAVRGGGLRRHLRRRLAREIGVTGEVPVRDTAATRGADRAITDVQIGDRGAELRRRRREQDRTGFGARESQRGAALLHGEAAGGLALVRRARGVAVDDVDALEIHVELVGGDLRERGADALSELDLAGEDGDASLRIDAQPRVEPPVVVEAAG